MSKEKATERINSKITSGSKKSSSKRNILIGVGILVVIIAAVILYFVFFRKGEENFNTVVTPENVDSIVAQLDESEMTPIGSYEVVMNTKWTFPDSTSASKDAYVENNVNNQNTVFFTITPKSDRKNVVYTSPDIPVGSKLENIKLEKELSTGEHDMVMTYHLIDENHKEISSVSVSLKITIKN